MHQSGPILAKNPMPCLTPRFRHNYNECLCAGYPCLPSSPVFVVLAQQVSLRYRRKNRSMLRFHPWAALVLLAVGCVSVTEAQDSLLASSRARELAPGVITTVEAIATDDDTADGPREFAELLNLIHDLKWEPNFDPETRTLLEMAESTTFQRQIWNLEFNFKPIRMLDVNGRQIWYLLYYVRNNGRHPTPTRQPDGSYVIEPYDRAIWFLPSFILESHGLNKAYRDTILPDALERIRQREKITGPLYDSASIARVRIEVGREGADQKVWGVAIWDHVDPKTDFVSVYVQGLTNAYRWQAPEAGYTGDRARDEEIIKVKTLQINFWIPGDEIDRNEGEVIYGIPLYPDDPEKQAEILKLYGLEQAVDYQWVYRNVFRR